jgi:hypothetical protein
VERLFHQEHQEIPHRRIATLLLDRCFLLRRNKRGALSVGEQRESVRAIRSRRLIPRRSLVPISRPAARS